VTPGELEQIDAEGFLRELKALRREIDESLGEADVAHLRKMERWGRLCTALGLATAGIAPNPLSAIALAIGRNTRWVLMHHIAHRGYDHVPGVPEKYTSKVFARGKRRWRDWADWVAPEAWVYEHNVLHHSHTGELRDPDLIEHNTELLRELFRPRALRYGGMVFLSLLWRPGFYGPNALRVWKDRLRDRDKDGKYDIATILRSIADPDYVKENVVPYAALHFGALPLLFAPLGPWAVFSAFVNSLVADVVANVQSFLVVLPNHSGPDLYRYDGPPASRAEGMLRQVVSSVNYGTGSDVKSLLMLWLNYQIEHHIWPDLPMLKYKQIQPRVRALCEKYGVPYVQEGLWARVKKMSDVVVGKTPMRRWIRQALGKAAA
jgi:fatty acid desaturase